MPPLAPPRLFGQGGYDETGAYWQQRNRELRSPFNDFRANYATPPMRAANGASLVPRLTASTTANSIAAPALPSARPAAPTGYVPPSYLYSPMQMVNDNSLQELMVKNPEFYANVYNNGSAVAQLIEQDNAQRAAAARQSAGASGGGGVTWDIPYGVDPVWYKQFTAEHEGKTPEDVYKRDGEYAIAHALSDKAWGDQFYRTYGRPPSEYDWKASYYQRQNTFYGG